MALGLEPIGLDTSVGRNFQKVDDEWDDRQRIMSGSVSDVGAVTAGTGFSSVRNALGDYSVTFANPFAAPPRLSFAAYGTGVGYHFSIVSKSAGGFRVTLTNAVSSAYADQMFDFVAVG